MSDVLARLKKKRAYPVTIEGELYHIRPMTIGEITRMKPLDNDSKTGFVVGCTLCDDEAGTQTIPKKAEPPESDKDWAARVLAELADVPSETIRALSEAVAALSKTPSASAVAKNS
jgi:hypothetical protein